MAPSKPPKKSTVAPKSKGKRTRQKRTNVVEEVQEEERGINVPLAGEQANFDSSAPADAARSTNEAAGLEEATAVRGEPIFDKREERNSPH
jgi:hypothetical protein